MDAEAEMSNLTQKSSPALVRDTGRDRADWFALLDAWGAGGRKYAEIAAWLTGEHGLSKWWAQKLIVEYEQARGLRAAGVRRDGTFSATATKTIGVPLERAVASFTEPALRRGWLSDIDLDERTSRPGRSARFDLPDGTRLNVDFAAKGASKTQVAVEHSHLPDAPAVAESKQAWRSRLAFLKELLEG